MRVRTIALGAVAVVVAVACSSSVKPGGRATLQTAPAPTDPWAPPTPLTGDYLEGVFHRLDLTTGNALRELGRTGTLNEVVAADLRAVFGAPQLERAEAAFVGLVAPGRRRGLRADPGNPYTTGVEVVDDRGSCVFVRATRTFAPALADPPPDSPRIVALVRGTPPNDRNPTGWTIILDAAAASAPPNPCVTR